VAAGAQRAEQLRHQRTPRRFLRREPRPARSTWLPIFRFTGSASENEEAVRRGLEVFSKWTPPAGITYHQFLGRLDGSGGFAVVEADNPMDLTDGPGKFGFIADYQVHPVGDMAEVAQAMQQGAEFRESIS
jgi:hypothetical protein